MRNVDHRPPTVPKTIEDEGQVAQPQDQNADVYGQESNAFDLVWRFFCSTRLALVLILIIAGSSLGGTLLLQAPAGVDYAQWLPQAVGKYGRIANLMSQLQLFDIFNSIWFRLICAGLILNIIVCTVNRWNGLWRSISKPRVRMGEGFFRKAAHSVVLSANGDVDETRVAVRRGFASHRYRVLEEQDGERAYLYADRNRFGKLGTFLNHLSLILIIVGAVAGGMFGFHERDFTVPVGSERAVGHGTNLTLRVDQFIDEYYPEGPPKDFRTDAVLFDNGKEVKRQTIRVNEPLGYDGIRFYQAYFGPAAIMQVQDANENVLFNDGVAMAWRTNEERPVGQVTLPLNGLEFYVMAPFSGRADPLIPAGQVRLEIYRAGTRVPVATDNVVMGRPKKVGDLQYTFVREVQFTGLQVASDPGVLIIWIACALLVVGLGMVFYMPHRRIWAVCRRDEQGRVQVTLGATARRDMGFDEEFRRVARAVKTSIVAGKTGKILQSVAEE